MRTLLFPVFFLVSSFLSAQVLPFYLNADHRSFIEEIQMVSSDDEFHPAIWPISRLALRDLLIKADSSVSTETNFIASLSNEWFHPDFPDRSEATNSDRLYALSEKSFLKHFYHTPGNFFQVDKPDFFLRLNPILNIRYGRETKTKQPVYYNQRGIDIRAGVDDKIFFYTRLFETQGKFAPFLDRYVRKNRAVPGNGFYKLYAYDLINLEDGFDFLNADGGISFHISKHVDLSLSHGRNFIGHGRRSLLLGDFADNYFHLKLNTKVWKFQYQNIFAELNAISALDNSGDLLIPKKYMAAHVLGFSVRKRLHIALFESVIFDRNNQFELQYLNPLILYRTVEQKVGSPDNVLLGIDLRYDIFKKGYVYGQIALDELVISEVFASDKWWGNKNGIQLGYRQFDLFGIDKLEGRIEYNKVRPYTYSHIDSSASYSHSNQSLAHPLGANFSEILVECSFRPNDSWRISLIGASIQQGLDQDDELSYGSDILISNSLRTQDYGIKHLQGRLEKVQLLRLSTHYNLKSNLYIDLQMQYRNSSIYEQEMAVSLGLRYNIANYAPFF